MDPNEQTFESKAAELHPGTQAKLVAWCVIHKLGNTISIVPPSVRNPVKNPRIIFVIQLSNSVDFAPLRESTSAFAVFILSQDQRSGVTLWLSV
jgi:hypothetical protein